jgi:hypothetical protein
MTTPPTGLVEVDNGTPNSLLVSAVDAMGFSTPDAGPFTFSLASGGSAVGTLVDNGDGTATISPVAPGTDTINCVDANGVSGSLAFTVEAGPAESLVITATPVAPPAGS